VRAEILEERAAFVRCGRRMPNSRADADRHPW
jgi:hypothetical protein